MHCMKGIDFFELQVGTGVIYMGFGGCMTMQ